MVGRINKRSAIQTSRPDCMINMKWGNHPGCEWQPCPAAQPTCSASQAICLTSLLPPAVLVAPSMALSSANTCGRRAIMLVWIATNQECAVAVSLQRRINVFLLSGECSSINLCGKRKRKSELDQKSSNLPGFNTLLGIYFNFNFTFQNRDAFS